MNLESWRITPAGLSGLHFGKHGMAQERSSIIYHSDSLFSALIVSLSKLETNSIVEDMMNKFRLGEPPFIITSAFPYAGNIRFFPMPFNEGFKIMVENQSDSPLNIYFYIDFEAYPKPINKIAYFHAWWNRENPTQSDFPNTLIWKEVESLRNRTDEENFLILYAEGKGHYVGCHLDIDCFQPNAIKWYGEGDDMIVIDGEKWPPRLHGTGTEDYFNTAYCPTEEFCTPFHGITLNSGDEEWPWKGKNSLYRYHIVDPIYFEQSIRVSIEHGHANHQTHDYSCTAYWYQNEPHKPFPNLPSREMRLPRP